MRIRSIKPCFWSGKKVRRMSFEARLLLIGLNNYCDDDGRGDWDPELIKVTFFPFDELDIETILQELLDKRSIMRYTVDGSEYLCIPNWKDLQVISHPKKSILPPPPGTARTETTTRAPKPSASTKKIPIEVQQIYDHWHSDDLVWEDPQTKQHRCRCPQSGLPWKLSQAITPDIIDNIKQHTKTWKVDQLIAAIENYHQVLTSKEYPSWTYRWSISEFFGRHMPNDKTQFAFYRFLPNNFDAERYARKPK